MISESVDKSVKISKDNNQIANEKEIDLSNKSKGFVYCKTCPIIQLTKNESENAGDNKITINKEGIVNEITGFNKVNMTNNRVIKSALPSPRHHNFDFASFGNIFKEKNKELL